MRTKNVQQYVGPNRIFVEGVVPSAPTRKTPVLCIGGAFDGSWIYARFTRILAELGWPTYAMNLRGYYKSACRNVAALSAADYLADIGAVRAGLQLKNVILVGYSIGGVLAQKSAEQLGAEALVLYDSDPSREIAREAGMKIGSKERVAPVLEFWPDQRIVEEMFGRKVTKQEYLAQLELFKKSRLSGKAYRELDIDKLPVGRIRCPLLILGISRRNAAHAVMFQKRNANWFVFEGYSHGGLLVSPEADRITRMVTSWLARGYPTRRRRVFRTVAIRDDKPTGLLAKGGSFPGKHNRRIAEKKGQHIIVADEGVIMELKYFSGWESPTVRVIEGSRSTDVGMRRAGEGRVEGEYLYESSFEMNHRNGFVVFEGRDEDRPTPGAMYRPELKSAWLADGEFFGYRPPERTTPPRAIEMHIRSKELEHDFAVRVQIPRNYNPAVVYPVAVLNDGQNQGTNFGSHGGWHTDSTTAELIRRGQLREIILAAVTCHRFRNRAYLPPPIARAHQYVDWLADVMLPELRRHFTIATNPSEIAIIGASFGANNAVYAGLKRPDVFGLVGSLSFAYLHRNPQIEAINKMTHRPFRRIYVDCGTNWADDQPGRDDYTAITRKLISACSRKWMTHGKDLIGLVAEGHYHNEFWWRKRIGGALRFLFRQE